MNKFMLQVSLPTCPFIFYTSWTGPCKFSSTMYLWGIYLCLKLHINISKHIIKMYYLNDCKNIVSRSMSFFFLKKSLRSNFWRNLRRCGKWCDNTLLRFSAEFLIWTMTLQYCVLHCAIVKSLVSSGLFKTKWAFKQTKRIIFLLEYGTSWTIGVPEKRRLEAL